MQRIHLLEEVVANQIAAGEVIERPASVVKELLENSLDAQATKINIEVEKGGAQSITIRDNGIGIHPEDLHLAFSRHGTSKIKDVFDLEKITTMGFRGEALASIASVAQVSLVSAIAGAEQGSQMEVIGGKLATDVSPAMHPQGTSIKVNELFFNTPARRKFLRSEKTEFAAIEEAVRRVALSVSHVRFQLSHNQKVIFTLPPAETEIAKEQRLAKLLNQAFLKSALKIETTVRGLSLSGWITLPDYNRPQGDWLYTYVNGRIVRDKLMTHAIREAYQDVLPHQRYPACVLFLECDPKQVDVNVHPTKHEVRFHEGRLIHDFILQTVREALKSVASPQKEVVAVLKTEQVLETENKMPESSIQESRIPYTHLNVQSWQKPPLHTHKLAETLAIYHVEKAPQYVPWSNLDSFLRIQKRYLCLENSTGLLIIDLILALRQINYYRLNQEYEQGQLRSLPLLVPKSIRVDAKLCSRLEEWIPQLMDCGIEVSQMSADRAIIRRWPSLFRDMEITTCLLDILNAFEKCADLSRENILLLIAEHAASSAQENLTEEGIKSMLQDLAMILQQQSFQLPDSIWREVSLEEMFTTDKLR